MVNRFLDMAFFYDAGKVAPRATDLDLDGLKDDFGLGLRFHGPFTTPLRVDFAKSSEGLTSSFPLRHLLRYRSCASTLVPSPIRRVGLVGLSLARSPPSRPAPRRRPALLSATIPSAASRKRRTPRRRRRTTSARCTSWSTTCSSSPSTSRRHAGEERQHDRRSARFELVHQSHRLQPMSADESPAARTPATHRIRPSGSDPREIRRRPPGFTAKDGKGDTWFVHFDPPDFAGGATAAVAIASKIFWALGYNQVESFLTTFDPKKSPSIRKRPCAGRAASGRPSRNDDMNAILERVARERGRHVSHRCRPAAARQDSRRLPVPRTRVPTTPTTSCRTSIGGNCGRCASSAPGRTSWTSSPTTRSTR